MTVSKKIKTDLYDFAFFSLYESARRPAFCCSTLDHLGYYASLIVHFFVVSF